MLTLVLYRACSLPFVRKYCFCRLKEVADRLNRLGQPPHPVLSNLRSNVKRICLGPAHIAFLLDDGRVCRVSFSVIADRLDLTKNDPSKK